MSEEWIPVYLKPGGLSNATNGRTGKSDYEVNRSDIEAVVDARIAATKAPDCQHLYKQRIIFGPGASLDVCFWCGRPWEHVLGQRGEQTPDPLRAAACEVVDWYAGTHRQIEGDECVAKLRALLGDEG